MPAQQINPGVAKWLFYGSVFALGLAVAIVVFQGFFRYSYRTDQTFGHTIRVDHLTDERCISSGSEEIARQLALPYCE